LQERERAIDAFIMLFSSNNEDKDVDDAGKYFDVDSDAVMR
jgi:hypothetical protein